MGTSISMDILKIENGDESMKPAAATGTATASGFPLVWIRVPRDDGAAVFAALSSWTGALSSITGASAASHGDHGEDADSGVAWRICAKGNYLGAIVHGSGQEVFRPWWLLLYLSWFYFTFGGTLQSSMHERRFGKETFVALNIWQSIEKGMNVM